MTSAALRERPRPGTPRPWTFPDVRRTVLGNGMAALICDLPTRPVVAVHVVLDIPRSVEPLGVDGVASIVAQGLREGTKTRDAEAFSEALESRGATMGAHAGDAAMRLMLGVPVSRLEQAMELLTEALREPAFPDREVERLVRQRLDAIPVEQADPSWRCGETMMATLFDPSERLSRPGEGTAETVTRIDRTAVAEFWSEHARASTATAVVAGDFAGLDVDALLERTVGSWDTPRAAQTARDRVLEAPPDQAVIVHRPGSVQTELRIARIGPNRHTATWPQSQLAAYVLGGTMTSRLMRKLREEKGYTYGVHASASSLAQTGVLSISAAVETAVTAPAVADALAEVRRLADTGVTDEERVFAREAITSAPRRMESAHQLAGALAALVEERLPDDFIPRNLERLEAATTAEVSAQGARDWRTEGLSLVAVGDADVVADPLRELGFETLRVETD